MEPWTYSIGTVLNIWRDGELVIARVAGYMDKEDNTMPLLVNLRIADGLRWGERKFKVSLRQIESEDTEWYERQHQQWEESIKRTADFVYAKMSPAERERRDAEYQRRRQRSPLDVMIDRACGLD